MTSNISKAPIAGMIHHRQPPLPSPSQQPSVLLHQQSNQSQQSSRQPSLTPDDHSAARSLLRTPKSERDKRTYRACLHCRNRKSRCDLYGSGEPGKPPCERCIREQHECILGGSRRGGRRVKRSASDVASKLPTAQSNLGEDLSRTNSHPTASNDYHSTSSSEARVSWAPFDNESRTLPPLQQEPPTSAEREGSKLTVDETVASTDLQNPADALEFLANVAERNSNLRQPLPPLSAANSIGPPPRPSSIAMAGPPEHQSFGNPPTNYIDFPPLNKGHISLDMIRILLLRYEDKYHQFFPLANPLAMEVQNLPTIAAEEPHLLAAILTVASKDEKEWWQVHETCSAHMQSLIAGLVYSGGGTVEAVEAMLILAEWVPRRPQATPAVGRGEEDGAAWMYVGTAIRLGYLLGIDRTGFRAESEAQSAELNRKRLAWAACYMSDRQISVRIGKAFWSRGPGPMTALRAQDFPSLQPRLGRQDDFAAIFQANLELTQLFSNAHDVLYATKSRSNQLNFGGEYVKYIDDFRVALRSWHSSWGVFTCSPALKASLILSYEYLRLYVNAFAYQATLNRLAAQLKSGSTGDQAKSTPTYPFADVAATPDARFIYDSIDAAKSLLSTFNSFVDPVETFRFMPLRYYLYVIYSACFLYKARSTGVMGGDTRGGIKRMILDTIDRLQKASACTNDVGDRYSRLVRLLWRKPPSRASVVDANGLGAGSAGDMASLTAHGQSLHTGPGQGPGQHDPNLHHNAMDQAPDQPTIFDTSHHTHHQHHHPQHHNQVPPSINTFSWLDLNAVGEYATNNNSTSGSMDGLDRLEDGSADGFAGFDANFAMGPMSTWPALSPSGIIF